MDDARGSRPQARGWSSGTVSRVLPARLIKLFTFGAAGDFPGEIVADPFCGTGTTCVAAKRMGRRWIGIDCVKSYVTTARVSIARAEADGGMDLRIGTHLATAN